MIISKLLIITVKKRTDLSATLNLNMKLINKEQLVKTVQAIRKYTEFFADIAIQSYEIQKFKYSIQGLYAILAAREVL